MPLEKLEFAAHGIVWGSAIYHLCIGIPSMISLRVTRAMVLKLYKLQIPEVNDPKFEYAVKPLGAFAIFTSLLCFRAVLAVDEGFFRFMCLALIVLFMLRAVLRLIYRDLVFAAFAVGFRRNLVNIAFNTLISGVLFLYLIRD